MQGAGRIGKGLRLDGSTNTIGRVTTSPSLEFTDLLTVQFWLFPNRTGMFEPVVSKIDSGTGNGWNIVHQSGSIRITLRFNNGAAITDYTVAIGLVPLSTWTNVAWAFNESTLEAKLYINGITRCLWTQRE